MADSNNELGEPQACASESQDMNHAEIRVSLSFEDVSMPPFNDILVLASRCPQGKHGVSKCMSLLSPNEFEMLEINNPRVEAILVSKRILQRLSPEKVIQILEAKVFPYISPGEIVKVDFKVRVAFKDIQVDKEL